MHLIIGERHITNDCTRWHQNICTSYYNISKESKPAFCMDDFIALFMELGSKRDSVSHLRERATCEPYVQRNINDKMDHIRVMK